MNAPSDVQPDPQAIAAGIPTEFILTVTHPEHGELVFRGPAPTAKQLLAHAVETDRQLASPPSPDSPPVRVSRDELSWETVRLAEAIAAIDRGGLIAPPVVSEDRDEDEQGNVHVTRVYFDAAGEPDAGLLIEVWMAFLNWRVAKMAAYKQVKEAVGKSVPQTEASPASAGASDAH